MGCPPLKVTRETKGSAWTLQEVTFFFICFQFNYFLFNYLVNVQRATPNPISLCIHTGHGLGLNATPTTNSFWQRHSTGCKIVLGCLWHVSVMGRGSLTHTAQLWTAFMYLTCLVPCSQPALFPEVARRVLLRRT